jgi:hypothetical protein
MIAPLIHLALALLAAGYDVAGVERNAQRLGLNPAQQKKVHQVVVETTARQQKARADVDLAELELGRLLELDAPDEKKVAKVLERLARLQGEVRTAETIGWLRIRAQLTKPQRQQLEDLRAEWVAASPAPASDPAPSAAQAASATPPANSGFVRVNTTPHTRVFIDGKDTGRMTPANFDLAAGKHRIGFSLDGRIVDTSTVDVTAGGTSTIMRSFSATSKTEGE